MRYKPSIGCRRLAGWSAVVACLVLGNLRADLAATGDETAPACSGTGFARTTIDASYVLSVRVRPLLFWIKRDNVGGARISVTEATDGARRLELLIGSDPAKTPMRINRWGYIAETTCAAGSDIVGLMTESEEQSIEQARASASAAPRALGAFKAVRESVVGDQSLAIVARLVPPEAFTYRDLERLLPLLPLLPPPGTDIRPRHLPEGPCQGFLGAVSALVDSTLETHARGGRVPPDQTASRPFVHGGRVYDVLLRSSRPVVERGAGAMSIPAIQSEFATRNHSTGGKSAFRLTYDPVAGVPLRIVYRPRWWFEAELVSAELFVPPDEDRRTP